jgi:hypothetical protein
VGPLPCWPATQLPCAVSLFAFLYSRESKAKGTQVARLVREERLSGLKLRATAMAAAGATPPSPSELLRPALPRLAALLAFEYAMGKRSNPVCRIHVHGCGEAIVAAAGRMRAGGSSCHRLGRAWWSSTPVAAVAGGRAAPAAATGRTRVEELVPHVLRFFMLQLLYTDVATMFLTCCNRSS